MTWKKIEPAANSRALLCIYYGCLAHTHARQNITTPAGTNPVAIGGLGGGVAGASGAGGVFRCGFAAATGFGGCYKACDYIQALGMARKDSYLYVARADNSVPPVVAKCTIAAVSGNLTCVDSGVATNSVFGAWCIVFSTAGTVAYIADSQEPKVKKCPVDASGNIGTCSEAFFFGAASYPEGMATTIRSDGKQIIAVGNDDGKLSVCTITATDDLACTINTISGASGQTWSVWPGL